MKKQYKWILLGVPIVDGGTYPDETTDVHVEKMYITLLY